MSPHADPFHQRFGQKRILGVQGDLPRVPAPLRDLYAPLPRTRRGRATRRARRGAEVREHAGSLWIRGPQKSFVAKALRRVGTSHPSIVVQLLRNPPLQIMLAPILKIWLFGVLYSPLVLYSLLRYRVLSPDLQERRRKSRLQPERVPNPEGELAKIISHRERAPQS